MAVRVLVSACFTCFGPCAVPRGHLELPGLQHDSQAYVATLTKRFPAGWYPGRARAAEQQASAAIAKQDWPAAAAALETRVAQGEATAKQYLDLATAQLKRMPPDPRLALFAAWMGFTNSQAGTPKFPACC